MTPLLVTLLVALAPTIPQYAIDSVRVRYTHFVQNGHGWQSAAGPMGQPGNEWVAVEQPQAEVTARLGDRVTQRIWLPVDAVTAASPDHSRFDKPYDYVDTVTTASRATLTGTFDSLTKYKLDPATDVFFRAAFHIEEPFESWIMGLGATRSLAEDNTVVGVSFNAVIDWFDRFDLSGDRHGRAVRSTENVNVDLTQVLSPTTIANVSYGGTLQSGEMGNTWASVPLTDGTRGDERLPTTRFRHAVAARALQWLPWQGVLALTSRAYLDSWGIGALTGEAMLTQRLFGGVYVRGNYRYHHQNAPSFYTIAADPMATGNRTADSDLAALHAQTIGGMVGADLPVIARVRDVHVDIGYERYVRSNDLTVHLTTCALGFRF
ncbi:MAG TPA: DUF3570 domain-containing protein [Polyangia bacterium]|nr:DUF3570 domain-containing protein [Polyangia bacterium]